MKKYINKNNKKKLYNLLNLVLMFLAWVYLYSQIKNHQSLFVQVTDLWNELQKNRAILSIVFVLMFLNWILEAKKWQILIKSLAKINLVQSLESVWIGLSLATFLPLGNYLGRIKNLPQKNRFNSAGALIVNGGLQFWVTMLGGVFGISQFLEFNNFVTSLLFGFWILIYLLGLFFYNRWSYKQVVVGGDTDNGRKRTRAMVEKKQLFSESLEAVSYFFRKNIYFASQYSKKDILKTTFLALLRYIVFVIQMILIFKAVNFSLSIENIIIGSSLLFAAKSILPVGGFLVGLSVREATALYFFGSLGEEKVVTITFLLWIINIGIPVLMGSVLLLSNKNK
ncbi:Uncharacterized protein family (UPF0104) [Bernardetia litoralis DSM 6794]|uniref:Uncharacterized protein family (UPF0104) n=1 Tax=Bernardetia litoralis (strain ATCC 23117 / DSM 6794 / NBRC 15988 / NCIMB 1366 / Fx l1 / Sio-4) TaxID=880071 RepID=I4AF56_BERLS|nr:lysylphosphatidylglycerol synthase domain-containing protein [Bernardetia litoralis]AFM02591.1 Uncharacterized protein family (UPF0104) [Bernardetia litoralis DSM 6794]